MSKGYQVFYSEADGEWVAIDPEQPYMSWLAGSPSEALNGLIALEDDHMPVQQFRDEGYLQEVNRMVLHPVGLALSADLVSGTLRVWDDRSDPGGTIYDPALDLEPKARMVGREFANRVDERYTRHGWIVQPVVQGDVGESGCSVCGRPWPGGGDSDADV